MLGRRDWHRQHITLPKKKQPDCSGNFLLHVQYVCVLFPLYFIYVRTTSTALLLAELNKITQWASLSLQKCYQNQTSSGEKPTNGRRPQGDHWHYSTNQVTIAYVCEYSVKMPFASFQISFYFSYRIWTQLRSKQLFWKGWGTSLVRESFDIQLRDVLSFLSNV
jgi:hypothetical protein